jgi:hypothetical protein
MISKSELKNSDSVAVRFAKRTAKVDYIRCRRPQVVLSRFELSTCRGESATGQLLIGEGFVRTAKKPFQII